MRRKVMATYWSEGPRAMEEGVASEEGTQPEVYLREIRASLNRSPSGSRLTGGERGIGWGEFVQSTEILRHDTSKDKIHHHVTYKKP